MNIFQNSVLSKYMKLQDSAAIRAAWQKFTAWFHNPEVQENIRNSKEEQYQGEFLIDLFVTILGYTKNPNPGFNITTEYKNVKDNKKADGAILVEGVVRAVIELKGTETTDLGRIENQAFGYKNNQPECVYVITSNFEKLRFYIDNAIEHIEFNLFTLSADEFELLWLCLAYTNIAKNIPKRVRDESVSREDVITKNLYNDYSRFKRELHQNLVALNPASDPLTLFRKSQKLLDRFLFLFFAEDRQLLPPNSVRLILDDWRELQDRDEKIALYARFRKYFGYLNTGFKGKRYDVFAYNGGLFKEDELLDSLSIDDELLYSHTLRLSEYDFASEVDVNILGHIFENSLNELDEIKAQLEGQQVDKAKSKRKKDGVFYTPKYITKYIVDNTVGKLCMEKKAALELIEEEYTTGRKRTLKTKQPLFEKLTAYRNWLLLLTICDPACGSGAFLNQALDFLINEHRYIDELEAKLLGSSLVLSDFENSILENNLFGVDINEESVEIARLSLWLRTAQPNRKLNNLNNNIKCGNSLIDDPDVAGKKAFNWQQEFPSVFAKGGFDVVIGNPPYGATFNDQEKEFLLRFKTFKYRFESYIYFFEKGINILNSKGFLGFITPILWLNLENCEPLRKFIFHNSDLIEINIIGENAFLDAVVNTMITIICKEKQSKEFIISKGGIVRKYSYDLWMQSRLFIIDYKISPYEFDIVEKIENNSIKLIDFGEIIQGITPYDKYRGQDPELIKRRGFHYSFKKDESCGKWLNGEDLNRYSISWGGEWLSYGNWLAAPREIRFFEGNRLLFREIPGTNKRIQAVLIEETSYYGHSITPFILNERNNIALLKKILCLTNSKLMSWYGNLKLPNFSKEVFPKLNPQDIKLLPIHNNIYLTTLPFAVKATILISMIIELQELSQKFHRTIQRKFNLVDLPGKLQNWYLLTYAEFISELAKKKVKLSLTDEAEWEAYFEQEARQALALKSEIDTTDKEIDRMVYELYGLTEEEIGIVEGGGSFLLI